MNKNYNRKNLRAVMFEVSYHKKTYLSLVFVMASVLWLAASNLATIQANNTYAADTADSSFQINVQDSIAVAVTSPVSGATGDVDEFLRNTVTLEVNTNVSNGFTASMYSRGDTNLTHEMLGSEYYIPTVDSAIARSSFPVNKWGYSLKSASLDGKTYGETDAGNNSSTYYPLTTSTASPIKVLTAASGTKSGTQSIYFGAKANAEKPAGTYMNTVVISVVTGTIEDNPSDPDYNPITPVNPATPNTDIDSSNTVATYTGNSSTVGTGISGHNGTTVNTIRSLTSTNETTTTEISAGDNRSSYAPAQGVNISTEANIAESSSTVPVGLAITSITAATAGVIFFILAKRDEDDEEDEVEEYLQ